MQVLGQPLYAVAGLATGPRLPSRPTRPVAAIPRLPLADPLVLLFRREHEHPRIPGALEIGLSEIDMLPNVTRQGTAS